MAKLNTYQVILVMNWIPSPMLTMFGMFAVVILCLPFAFSLMALLFPGAAKCNSSLPYTPALVKLMPYYKALTVPASYVIFIKSISLDLSSPTLIFQDNQGTIKLVHTTRITETV
jgi:hypothetical protein